jgi:glycosyltransferase involved in cell wall biosynthesis
MVQAERDALATAKKNGLTPRRWAVNGRFLTRKMTGVDRYAMEILSAMDALLVEEHPATRGLELEVLCPAEGMKSPFSSIPARLVPKAPGHLWEQLILPRYVRGGLLSLCNTGPMSISKQIVCIHDMNIRLAPESYGFLFRAVHHLEQRALGWRAARIVTVSRFSRESIARYRIRPTDEIEVIHNGHEHVLEWKVDSSKLAGLNLPRPFVLLIGSKAAHKNVAMIYSIAPDLAAKGIHIVAAGGEDANVFAREHIGQLPPNVKHLGRVDDNDLAFLYQNALCLVFPSRTEGFGLPALEAMTLGCPVIASDAASLPEVCGGAVLYVSPNNRAAWLAAIGQIAAEPLLRGQLTEAGRKRAKVFSWRQSAEKYLELMLALDCAGREK